MSKEEEVKKMEKKSVSIDEKEDLAMEEGHHSKIEMPNLPKPLTLEEKKYLLAVERGDINTTRKMLQKAHRHHDYMNMNCVDPLGRGALHMSISNENLEMVELLVVMGVETRDALLHAIDAEFVEAVEVLLEHEEVVHKEGDKYSWEKADRNTSAFTPEITPLILAAHKDNYEILKILLDRGATIPMPHDIRCGCPECLKTSSEDSLRHSRSRINAYRALASPSLIALTSTDPILTAFQLSLELKNLAYTEHEFRADYLELRTKCMKFAEELLGHARSSTELAVMLNHDPECVVPYEDGEHMSLKRLELAIDCKQKRFVAHPNIQQLLAALWYEGVPGFRRKSILEKCTEIFKVVALFPFYCMWYMLLPDSPTGRLMRTPFMKFLTHSASYLFFLLLLILVSVRFENLVIWFLGTDAMRRNLEEAMRRQRGNLPTPVEFVVALWVFGFLWEEIKEIRSEGFRKYINNMWNILDIMRDFLYIFTMILRLFAFIQQTQEISRSPSTAFIPREEWNAFDPQLISEGLFAAANILSALKLVHIFSINPYLGPLQISLGRMVIDIVKFFFIYTLVLFAFACGLTQLLWYYNGLEKDKCYSLPGGEADWTKQGDACMRWRRFYNLFEASQSLFWAGFGMVGLDDFELTGIREYTRFWSMLMFGSYSVINIIVLLNLLIAMMSSSYSFIVEHADTEWKFARTKLWMSYFEEGNTLPPPFNMFPNVKSFMRMCGKTSKKNELVRRMSSRSQNRRRKAMDFRYLSVMRALIWRYVCALQRRNEERPVNEDDIGEVKGDISSLRFELIDLFGQNGMDVSMCAKKSRAALGRKMRVWERRLMRDFHVSPAMGAEDTIRSEDEPMPQEESAADKFRRMARLAMSISDENRTNPGQSQIGMGDDKGRESLKMAMEKARRKMEEGTPDGSPGSSRGCSPFPDLYTGPHLLDAIKNLDLSPNHSPSETPMPDGRLSKAKDGQAKDLNKLMVPGRRASTTLKKEGEDTVEDQKLSLDVPVNMFSKDSIKKLTSAIASEDKSGRKAPVIMKTESETKKSEAPAGIKKLDVTKVAKEDAKVQQKEAPVIDRSLKNKEQSVARPTAPVPQTEAGIMKPSQVKATGSIPASNQQKPQEKPQEKSSAPAPPKNKLVNDFPIIQTPPPVAPTAQRRAPEPERRPAPARVQQVKQPEEPKPTFTGTADLESMDFVRRPTRPPPQQNVTPPSITVIPSTPKPSDVPVPPSPTHDIIVKKASANTPPASQPKETPKPAEPSASKPQLPKNKPEEIKPKPVEPKAKPEESKPKPVESKAKPEEPKPKPAEPKAKPEEPKPKPAESKAKPEEPKPKPAEPKAKPEEPKPKPAEPKEKPKEKAAAPKAPAEKSQEQKPSTPPAATFQNNASSSANEPLIKAEPKKGGWL